jgi:phosphatidylinositol glycan class T
VLLSVDSAFTLLGYQPSRPIATSTSASTSPSSGHHGQYAPTLLEARLHIPAGARLTLAINLDKRFLRYTEHPPDAQRGWDLPGAVFVPLPFANDSDGGDIDHLIMYALNSSDHLANVTPEPRTYIHTRTLLLDLATPDFSMPYNVIIMSCALITLMFSSIFNMLTREFVVVDMTAWVEGEKSKEGKEGEEGDKAKEATMMVDMNKVNVS